MTGVNVRLDAPVYARLRAEAHRQRSTVATVIASLATDAAAFLPDPPSPRPLAVVLRERVEAYLADGWTVDEIATHLGVPAERVQRVADEIRSGS